MHETNLSPADLAWIQRLPDAADLTHADVQALRGLRRTVDRSGGTDATRLRDLRLLDSMLAHADDIEAQHSAPTRAAQRLDDIDQQMKALANGSHRIAARRLAEASARVEADRIESEAMAAAMRRVEGMGTHDREEELARVRAAIGRMRVDLPNVVEGLTRDHEAEMERKRNQRVRDLHAERTHLQKLAAS